MTYKPLPLCVSIIVLAGCSADPSTVQLAAAGQGIHVGVGRAREATGYWYQDGTHPNAVTQASAQAESNANHGTWLWPPEGGGG